MNLPHIVSRTNRYLLENILFLKFTFVAEVDKYAREQTPSHNIFSIPGSTADFKHFAQKIFSL